MKKLIVIFLFVLISAGYLYAEVNTVANPAEINGVTDPDEMNTVTGLAGGAAATISHEETVGNSVTSSSVEVTPSSAASEGELLILLVCSDTADSGIDDADGFTAIDGGIVTQGTTHSMYAYYKEAGASEPNSYTFDLAGSGRTLIASLTVLSTTGSTWNIDDEDTSTDASATAVATTSVTVGSGDYFVAGWAADDGNTIGTAPTDMTQGYFEGAGGAALATYHQASLSGATTKTLTWGSGTQTCTWAIVIGAE